MTYGIFLVGQILLSKTAEGLTPSGMFSDSLMSPSKYGCSLNLIFGDCSSVCVCEMFSKHNQRTIFCIHDRILSFYWFTSRTAVSSAPWFEMTRHSWAPKKNGIRAKIVRNDGLMDFIFGVLQFTKYNLHISLLYKFKSES